MPLPIRDGNQSLTTLSTILVSNSHIPAHTVISFGTQGITDIATAVSGVELGPNTLNALENITVTLGQVTITGGLTDAQLRASAVTIGGSVTATISGTPSVTFGQASVTFGTAFITGSTSILNFPATQAVTFTQASVTFSQPTITGSVSVLNFPASQSVTFTTATVTFGTAVITGSTSIIGTPSITFGLISGTVTVGNSVTISSLPALAAGTAQIGVVTIGNIRRAGDGALTQLTTEVGSGALQTVIGSGTAQIGSVTASISNSVAIASLPAISGTVTANVPFFNFGEGVSDGAGNLPIYGIQIGYADSISAEFQLVADNKPLPISGTVTANIPLVNIQPTVTTGLGVILLTDEGKSVFDNSSAIPATLTTALPAGTNSIGVVTIGAGTVTANSSNGSLTTRFGSVTTANTAFATSAVTNTNRKYLLIQNITTASNVITVGIGFTPTTTQGIQLFSGAGLTFEGSYIPTGAVNLLSSVTASCYTILEA